MSVVVKATVGQPARLSNQPADAKAKAHHNEKGKGFHNPWPSWGQESMGGLFMKIMRRRFSGGLKNPDVSLAGPVRKPTFLNTRETRYLRSTWLGHACCYVEFPGGLRVLFDPVFEERCSPFSFLGPKRYTEAPCKIEDIPYVDAVCISHSHYDHCSLPTITAIQAKFPNVEFFVPLGNKEFLHCSGLNHVTELDWWDERSITLTVAAEKAETSPSRLTTGTSPRADQIVATIGCLPCQHASGRTLFDRNQTLWSSWSVTSGGKKVWFGGDTGYRCVPELPEGEFHYDQKYADLPFCPAFAQIGEHRGPFDLGLIPIGAYEPRYIFSSMHADPYDSANIFADTKCKRAIGIHWNTWVLTPEAVQEPPKLLKEALKWKGLPETGAFDTCDIGEAREF